MSALKKPSDFASARFHMVESQIRPNKVRDERVLDAMGSLPREIFVPSGLSGIAYIDEDLLVAAGRFLLEPMILARLIEEAKIKPTDSVLDIAPATGYSTAILATIAKEVTAIESDPAMQKEAAKNLTALKIANAHVLQGALTEGYKEKAPYDVILLNGSVDVLPPALLVQLGEGGRLLAVVRQFGPAQAAHTGEARLYENVRGHISYRVLFDANVKPLPGFQSPPKFVF